MANFSIYSGSPIKALKDWKRLAPPAHPNHWREGRSAMELARRWIAAATAGGVPEEVAAVLEDHADWRGFVPERAFAEMETRLDDYRGKTRQHDLVVTGTIGSQRAVLDIEGKVDETFNESLSDAARNARKKKSPSKVGDRIAWLTTELFGTSPDQVHSLRYQLLFGAGAAVLRAVAEGADRVAFVVHTIATPDCKERKMAANSEDLRRFVEALAVRTHTHGAIPVPGGDAFLMGPFEVPGGGRLPRRFSLYIGAVKTDLRGSRRAGGRTASR